MSLQMSTARTFLRTFRKPQDPKLDYVKSQRDNAPLPQQKIAKKHTIEPFQVGGARAVWLRNPGSRATLVFLHGGSYITGPHAEHWEWLSHLTTRTRTDALVIDYRLSPQHPFPAGFDDALTIVRALQDDGTLGSRPWLLVGDSAGGGMALAVAHALRDEGRQLPWGMLLMSPWVDLRERTYPNAAADPWLTPIGSLHASRAYAGDHDASNVAISPIMNSQHALPHTYVEAAGDDILVTEGRELVAAMGDAGVHVDYHEAPGRFHVYPLVGWIPEAQQARARQVDWINALLA